MKRWKMSLLVLSPTFRTPGYNNPGISLNTAI